MKNKKNNLTNHSYNDLINQKQKLSAKSKEKGSFGRFAMRFSCGPLIAGILLICFNSLIPGLVLTVSFGSLMIYGYSEILKSANFEKKIVDINKELSNQQSKQLTIEDVVDYVSKQTYEPNVIKKSNKTTDYENQNDVNMNL